MEWATSVRWSGLAWVVRIATADGIRFENPAYLVSHGLPTQSTNRCVLEQRLDTWSINGNPQHYAAAMNIGGVIAGDHEVYETHHNGLRVLVPALVLMRAFFRPTMYLLPRMFRPAPLDCFRHVDFSERVPAIRLLSSTWNDPSGRYGDLRSPISWMTFFPSGSQFAASVYENARMGRLAVTLPRARVRMAVQGRVHQGLFLATSATLLRATAEERPFDWACSQSSLIYERSPAPSKGSEALKLSNIPCHPDGTVDILHSEWAHLEPMLIDPAKRDRHLLDQRLLVSGAYSGAS